MTTNASPEVAGKAFLGGILYIKSVHGAEALARVVERGGPEVREVFAHKIRPLGWHPYPAYAQFLVACDRELGKGDLALCRALGLAASERDLDTGFKLLKRLLSAERLIRACERVWPSYYRNAGNMEALEWQPESTTLRISDFRAMHPAHCKLMEGWMIGAMGVIGARVGDDGRETHCVSRGSQFHEFRCTWSRR